jgi:hypothetical protein
MLLRDWLNVMLVVPDAVMVSGVTKVTVPDESIGVVVAPLNVMTLLETEVTVSPFGIPVPTASMPAAIAEGEELARSWVELSWVAVSANEIVRFGVPEDVAALAKTNVVPLVTEATVSFEGMPVPETDMPAKIPVVEATVTVVVEFVVALIAGNANVTFVALSTPVVAAVSATCVPSVTDAIVSPLGIPLPEAVIPAVRLEVVVPSTRFVPTVPVTFWLAGFVNTAAPVSKLVPVTVTDWVLVLPEAGIASSCEPNVVLIPVIVGADDPVTV